MATKESAPDNSNKSLRHHSLKRRKKGGGYHYGNLVPLGFLVTVLAALNVVLQQDVLENDMMRTQPMTGKNTKIMNQETTNDSIKMLRRLKSVSHDLKQAAAAVTRSTFGTSSLVRSLRLDFMTRTCQEVFTESELERHLSTFFKPPSTAVTLSSSLDPKDKPYTGIIDQQPCMFTFIDLGANIGDSLGKFIDAGFPAEDCPGLEHVQGRAMYDIEQGVMTLGDSNTTELTDFVRKRLQEHDRGPEDYCYVGVEGNPVFTSTLKELEAIVRGSVPKPVYSANFLTETVGAGTDGPTILYLDTVNGEQNFWGSSLVQTHIDVAKSAIFSSEHPGPLLAQANVMGVTLSTLLQRWVQPEPGAHVIIKMDIEGGEYPVLNEAVDTLCEYTQAGVQVDLILETHSIEVLGGSSRDFDVFQTKTIQKMKHCDIQLQDLSPKWGQ